MREKTTNWFSAFSFGRYKNSAMWTYFRSKNGRRQNTMGKSISIFELLPRDILLYEIISKLCLEEEGLRTLCRLACVCKFFDEVANHPDILRKANISFDRSYFVLPDSKQCFVCKCSTMGNRRAIALIGNNHGFEVGERGARFYVKERLYASYFLGMILFESESTRQESSYLLSIVLLFRHREIMAELRQNARNYLLSLRINRPLNRVNNDCNDKCCGWWKMRLGYSIDSLTQPWCNNFCKFSYEYELLRVASGSANE